MAEAISLREEADAWATRLAAFHRSGRCGSLPTSPGCIDGRGALGMHKNEVVGSMGRNVYGGVEHKYLADPELGELPAEVVSVDGKGIEGRARLATCVETRYRQSSNIRLTLHPDGLTPCSDSPSWLQ